MADFTYELPSNKAFYDGVKAMVSTMTKPGLKDVLSELLSNGSCELVDTGSFSKKRWDATGVIVRINVSMQVFSKYSDKIPVLQKELVNICDRVMPANAGYDVIEISISPLLEPVPIDTLKEIKDIVSKSDYLNISDDLVEKGKKMANAYVTLYALENHIRHYIDTKLIEKYGDNYMDTIVVSRKAKSGIDSRKQEEQAKKWLPLRGDKDLYYMDFNDLADIIVNNWDCFKNDIPDQGWIKVKIQEMYDIRCLIAHNSYISDDNVQLLELTTKQIISQLYS